MPTAIQPIVNSNGTNYAVNASGTYGGQLNNGGQDLTKATADNPSGRFDYTPPASATTSSASTVNPSVITSTVAKDNLASIRNGYTDIKTGVSNQATTNANTQAQAAVANQAATTQANADKVAADKAATDKATAQAKLAAINGPITSPTAGEAINDTRGKPGVSAFDANTGAPQTTPAPTQGQNQGQNTDLGSENNSYQNTVTQAINEQASAYNDYKTQVQQLQNGTFPLSGAQKALVDSTASAFDEAIKQANLRGAALSSETGGFSNKVTQSLGEIANIDSQKASALAKLEIGFQEEDYKMITDSYNAYTSAEKTKTDMLSSLHSDVVKQADDLRQYNMDVTKLQQDASQFATKSAEDTRQFNVSEAEKEKSDAFDRAYKMEDLALKKRANAIAAGAIAVPSVPITATGKPDAESQKAFLASLPPTTATGVQQLTSYQMNPADFSTRSVGGGISQRQQMLTLAHQYDPTYDENQYAARAAYLKNLQSGTLSQGILSANKAISHLTSWSTALDQVGNGNLGEFANKIRNNLNAVGNPKIQTAISTANTEANGVKDELAKFFKGTGATDVKSVDDWAKQLSTNLTPGDAKGTVQGAVTLMAGQIDAMQQQYASTMGQPPDLNKILQPQTINALSNLKNKGYQVDIPGVSYTDTSAYLKYEPAAQQNMSDAVKTLTSMGQPLTPENILQAAQYLHQ